MTTISIPLHGWQLFFAAVVLVILISLIVDTVQAWREEQPLRAERRLTMQRLGGVPWWRRMVKR